MAIEGAGEQTTLRDVVAANFDAAIPPDEPVEAPASAPETPAAATEAQDKPAAGDERPRGPDGKFLPVKAPDNKGFVSAAAAKADTPKDAKTAAAPEQVTAEPAKPLQRPSSWKKEMWPLWEKLATGAPLTAPEARQIAEYNLQRETEAARGVSAYKDFADRIKPLAQAFEPHRADFERWGIDPGAQFSKYIEIHKGLALGTEEQKLATLARIAQDYKIPVEKMFIQQNGQLFYNPQVQQAAPQPQPQQQQMDSQAIERTVQSVIQRERMVAEIASMEKDTVKFPHFEAVRNTMGQLIDARIASPDDLPGAYESALALPQHRELQQQAQALAQASAEAARKAQQAAEAQRARAAAVSPKSATPASGPAKAQKGLRDSLVEQFDAVTSGRV